MLLHEIYVVHPEVILKQTCYSHLHTFHFLFLLLCYVMSLSHQVLMQMLKICLWLGEFILIEVVQNDSVHWDKANGNCFC